jgi:RND family efflux transporter MFP subunit
MNAWQARTKIESTQRGTMCSHLRGVAEGATRVPDQPKFRLKRSNAQCVRAAHPGIRRHAAGRVQQCEPGVDSPNSASVRGDGTSRAGTHLDRAPGTNFRVSCRGSARSGRRHRAEREFKEGGDVNTGQRLYQIDPAPYIAALNTATASLQKAQANLAATTVQAERYKILVAANAVSKQDYDNAVSMQGQAAAYVATGKAAVALAQINLGYTNVVSPIVGRSGISQVTQGAFVQASAATLMTTVQQIDPIYVDVTQSSVEGLQLRHDIASGQLQMTGPDQAKVTLLLEDGTENSTPGSLQFTDITVDQSTGSVTVRAIFPNPRSVLLPGMFVRARIEEGVNDHAFLVPQTGVTSSRRSCATLTLSSARSTCRSCASRTASTTTSPSSPRRLRCTTRS